MRIATGALVAALAVLALAGAAQGASRIVYSVFDDEIDSDVYSVLANGKGDRGGAVLDGEDTDPSWGPSRRRLVFVHDDQLWVVRANANSKGARRISRRKGAE